MYTVLRAAIYAADARRNSPIATSAPPPQLGHAIGVAAQLAYHGIDDAYVLAAAMLHDTVEHTATTLADIHEAFGREISTYVAEVTDDKTLPLRRRRELQIVNAIGKCRGAAQILMAAKLQSLRAMTKTPLPDGWDEARVQGYFVWAHRATCWLHGGDEDPNGLRRSLMILFAEARLPSGAPAWSPHAGAANDALLEAYLASLDETMTSN